MPAVPPLDTIAELYEYNNDWVRNDATPSFQGLRLNTLNHEIIRYMETIIVGGGGEPTIAAGLTSQYWRGDKSWQTLNNVAVGLGNVPNVNATNAANISTGFLPAGRYGASTIPISAINATGTPSGTTILFGDGTWGAYAYADGDKGDVTISAGGTVITLNDDAVTLNKLPEISQYRVLGRVAAGIGDVSEITGSDITAFLDVFNSTTAGIVTASGGGTTNFLRADGTWAPAGGGGTLSDGTYNDIIVSSGGTILTIANLAVTNSMVNDVAWTKITGAPSFTVDSTITNGSTNAVESNAVFDALVLKQDVLTPAAIGSTPNANGLTLSGAVLNLQPASAAFGGAVTTTNQAFAGEKTFDRVLSTGNNTTSQLKIGSFELQGRSTTSSLIGHNVYFDGTSFTHRLTGPLSFMDINPTAGSFLFGMATSATAGTAATVTYPFGVYPTGLIVGISNGYMNFNSVTGTAGYGFRDNAGVLEWKNAGGSWAIFGAGGGSGTVTTASNGLTPFSASEIKLGGTLSANTSISTSTFNLNVTGTSSSGGSLNVINTGTGPALLVSSDSGVPAQFTYNFSTTNSAESIFRLVRATTGTAANGIGGAMTFLTETSTGASQVSNEISSRWTDVTNGTRTSALDFFGTNSASNDLLVTFAGNGQVTLHGYDSAVSGTAAFNLAVDSAGKIITSPTLVSGTTLKTINGNTLLGSGDLTITAITTSTIYVSPSGIGTGTGSTPGTAITMAYLITLSASFVGGEKIYFEAGGTYRGKLTVKSNTYIGKYGDGAAPILSGTVLSTSVTWTQAGAVWSAPYATRVGQLLRNGARERTAQSAFYTITANGGTTLTASTATGLGAWVTDAELISKEYVFRWTFNEITAYNSGTGMFTLNTTNGAATGFKFRLFNHQNLITTDGDWAWVAGTVYYQSPGNVNPNTLNVELSVHDEGIFIEQDATNIVIDGVEFYGQAIDGVYGKNITNISVANSTFTQILSSAIMLAGDCRSILIDNNEFDGIGFTAYGGYTNVDFVITRNRLTNIGTQVDPPFTRQVTARYDNLYSNNCGIVVSNDSKNGVISDNIIDNVAYVGIRWDGHDVKIFRNRVSNFSTRANDGGGIYANGWRQTAIGAVQRGEVSNNIVWGGIASQEGTSSYPDFTVGVYLDAGCDNTKIIGNTLYDNDGFGIFVGVSNHDNEVTGNICYNNSVGQIAIYSNATWDTGATVTDGIMIRDNTFASLNTTQNTVYIYDGQTAGHDPFSSGGFIKNNTFIAPYVTNHIVDNTNGGFTIATAATYYSQPFGQKDAYTASFVNEATAKANVPMEVNLTTSSRVSVVPAGFHNPLNKLFDPLIAPMNATVYITGTLSGGGGGEDLDATLTLGATTTQSATIGGLNVINSQAAAWMVAGSGASDYAQMIFSAGAVASGNYAEFLRFPAAAATHGTDFIITNLTHKIILSTSYSGTYSEDLAISSAGVITMARIGTATESNVLYYNTTTKAVTYGATPSGGGGGGDMVLANDNLLTGSGKIRLPTSSADSNLRAGSFEWQSRAVNETYFFSNAYFDGTDYKYRANGIAQLTYYGSTAVGFYSMTSGTAGATATPVERLIIYNTGNIKLGTAGSYLNWGATEGTTGYGLRDNSGTIEVKNSGGSWAAIGSGGSSQWTTSGSDIYYNSAGFVGIGVVPDQILDIEKNYNGGTNVWLKNTNAHADVVVSYLAQSDAGYMNVGMYSSASTPFGAIAAGSAFMYTNQPFTFMAQDAAGYINFAVGGINESLRFALESSINYINFGGASGASDYGFRNNAGVMEYKDSGGSWIAFNTL